MVIILGNVIALSMLACLGISLTMALKFWRINGAKLFFTALLKGLLWALGTFVVSFFLIGSFFITRCLGFSMPFQIYLILFFCLILFLAFSSSKKNRIYAAIFYILIFSLLSGPSKALGKYFYSPFSLRLHNVEAYESTDQSTTYPAAWLNELPIKNAVLNYWGWTASPKDGTVVVIRPTALWHSYLTGLYAIEAKSVRVWYPGGKISEGINKLEFREQKIFPSL